MLIFASGAQLDAFSRKVLLGLVGENDAAFTVGDELPHRAMHTDPKIINCLHEGLGVLVRDNSGCMPPGTPADHVEDDVLADEKQVALHLVVELVRNFHTADVVWTRLGRPTADFTCLN